MSRYEYACTILFIRALHLQLVSVSSSMHNRDKTILKKLTFNPGVLQYNCHNDNTI